MIARYVLQIRHSCILRILVNRTSKHIDKFVGNVFENNICLIHESIFLWLENIVRRTCRITWLVEPTSTKEKRKT